MNDPRLRALRAPLAPLVGAGLPGLWLVGGGIRDALLGRSVADLDLAIAGDAAAAARRLARAHDAHRFPISRAFGAWRVSGGSLPFQVDITPLQGATIAHDLARRDFTVNALAAPLEGDDLIDIHGGRADLEARRLRPVSADALRADPVRLLRLARFAEQLAFTVDPVAQAAARASADRLWRAPGERLAMELGRILMLPRPDRALRTLDRIAVLGVLVPQLEECRGVAQSPYHHLDVLGHTLEVVEHATALAADPEPVFRGRAARVRERLAAPLADELTNREGLLLAALLHDMAKAATRGTMEGGRITFIGHDRLGADMAGAFCERLRSANRLRDMVSLLILRHLPLGFLVHRTPLSLRQIDRYLRLTAPYEPEVILLTVADRLATNGPRTGESAIRRHLVLAREVMDQYFALADRGPVRPLMGGDRIAHELGRAPGPWMGRLLEALREEQLVGAVTTAEATMRFAREWDRRDREREAAERTEGHSPEGSGPNGA